MLNGVRRMGSCTQTRQFLNIGSTNDVERYQMELVLVKENEDGSADYNINISAPEIEQIVRFGLIEMLRRMVEEGKKHDPI
jgi:hypothetical protein